MTVNIDNLTISRVDNHVTATIAHDVQYIASTLYRNFRNANINGTFVIPAYSRLKVARDIAGQE